MKLKYKPKAGEHPLLTAWRELPHGPEGTSTMRNLRGSYKAKLLLLSEHPNEKEHEEKAPFTSEGALLLMEMFNEVGFTEKDFFIVPFSRFGEKPNKASTTGVLDFVRKAVEILSVKAVVCVGMNAFGHTFAAGRKTHADTIIGNPMWLPYVGNRPVFVLPDTARMFPLSEKWRDINFAQEQRDNTLELCRKLYAWQRTL